VDFINFTNFKLYFQILCFSIYLLKIFLEL
jgi:hypothetical protein